MPVFKKCLPEIPHSSYNVATAIFGKTALLRTLTSWSYMLLGIAWLYKLHVHVHVCCYITYLIQLKVYMYMYIWKSLY